MADTVNDFFKNDITSSGTRFFWAKYVSEGENIHKFARKWVKNLDISWLAHQCVNANITLMISILKSACEFALQRVSIVFKRVFFFSQNWQNVLKGALDKSNIYLFISSSIEDCKSN